MGVRDTARSVVYTPDSLNSRASPGHTLDEAVAAYLGAGESPSDEEFCMAGSNPVPIRDEIKRSVGRHSTAALSRSNASRLVSCVLTGIRRHERGHRPGATHPRDPSTPPSEVADDVLGR